MSAEPQVVALVPMRHVSERVPGKNYRELAGRPLYAHILDTLGACNRVERIVVDTDSELIRDGIAETYPQVVLLERPKRLRDGAIPMNEVLLHDVEQVPAPYYLQTHSTNPLLQPETIRRAVDRFLGDYPDRDSLFSVTRLQARLWDGDGRPINHDPSELLRTQDLPPVYLENSCLYLFEREGFLSRRNRIGERPQLFEIDPEEAWDIDDEHDFAMVERLLIGRAEGS